MPDTKISSLASLTGSTVSSAVDVIPIVSISATTTKKLTVQGFYDASNQLATITSSKVSQADSLIIFSVSTAAAKILTVSSLGSSLTGVTVTGANPTAIIGTAAVNGTAGTFLRSDGAPALGNLTGDVTSVGLATTFGNLTGPVTSVARATTYDPAGKAVGSLALLICLFNNSVANGATDAGSNYKLAFWNGSAFVASGAALSGTWRNMSGDISAINDVSLFQRVS